MMSSEEMEVQKEKNKTRKADRKNMMSLEEMEAQKEKVKTRKANERYAQKERLAKLKDEFPPNVDEQVTKKCISNFIEATSYSSLSSVVCGICALRCREYEEISAGEVPGRELLLHENSDSTNLSEYMIGELLLHPLGVDDTMVVNCCKSCLNDLRKGKLPATSIANNLQIGESPPELSDLTLPERLLIAVYRPKMYVTTFRSVAGPGSAQRGLKGNTISFPQDIVKVSEKLSAHVDVLADTIKVIFIGSTMPRKEQLRKVLTVRRSKVLKALAFLQENHSMYSNITITSGATLPEDDIPDVV